MIKPWLRHAALEPGELQALQGAFDRLKAELELRAESDLQALAHDLMTAYERFGPDCAKAADSVRDAYRRRG